jgi:transposase-like protein
MPRVCTVCVHPEREAIDAALVSGTAYTEIARTHEVGREAVRRHANRHLSAALAALRAPTQAGSRAPLSDRIETLIARCEVMFTAAASEGRTAQALAVVKELRACLELAGRASGELRDQPAVVVNLQTSPEWLQVRAVILTALMAYPEARAAVSGRLLELESGQ